MSEFPSIPPDTRDWAEVLDTGCTACGFTETEDATTAAARLRDLAQHWTEVLHRADAQVRPAPQTWSPVEYAGHVRDVCAEFEGRTRLIRTEDDPLLPSFDGGEVALESGYARQDPQQVHTELLAAVESYAAEIDRIEADQWQRTGHRDDGRVFTLTTQTRYGLHEMVHHLQDVGVEPGR